MAAANLMQVEADALIAMEKRRSEGFGDNDVRGVLGWISPHGGACAASWERLCLARTGV